MNVLVIAEDDRNDRYILLPIIRGMFRALKRPHARVEIYPLRNGGWDAVKQLKLIRTIVDDNRQADLFLLCVDRDGDPNRRQALDGLEEKAHALVKPPRLFLAVHAFQEIEVWALAGINWRLKPTWTWKQIQSERDPKEHYFEPIARHRGLLDSVGQGRKILGEEAGSNYSRVRQNCSELRELEGRIKRWMVGSAVS
jgi:hypothetical protein